MNDRPARLLGTKLLILLFSALVSMGFGAQTPQAAKDGLIPRLVLFSIEGAGNPQFFPDGKLLSYIRGSDKGVPNVWVRTIGRKDDHMAPRSIRNQAATTANRLVPLSHQAKKIEKAKEHGLVDDVDQQRMPAGGVNE